MTENDVIIIGAVALLLTTLWWKHRVWRANRLLTRWMAFGMKRTSKMMNRRYP